MSGKRTPLILIVDDTPQNLQVLGNLLKETGCDIAVAGNGRQAMEIAGETRPDLILLDVMMPGMDGYQTCKKLKGDPDTMDIPVIFLTARTESEDVVSGFKAGAVDYITKPFNGIELLTRVKTHLALKETRDELETALKTRNKFFNIIAHDLKNPLNTILGFSDLLRKQDASQGPDEFKEYADYIFKSAKAASDLLSNLLDWSRIQTGKLKPEPEAFPVRSLLSSVRELLEPTAKKKEIKLEIDVPGNMEAIADYRMISTVVRNLGSNAIKFSPTGSKVRFIADADSQTGRVRIAVQDKGMGISPDRLEKLFDVDKKVTRKGTAKEEGTGLGLILSKEFTELNNGILEASSRENKGSTFSLILPAKS